VGVFFFFSPNRNQALLKTAVQKWTQLAQASSVLSRRSSSSQLAVAMTFMSQLSDVDLVDKSQRDFEVAQILHQQGQYKPAIALLSSSSLGIHTSAEALATMGKWVSESHLEPPETIQQNYLRPSVQLADKLLEALLSNGKSSDRGDLLAETYHTVATFADDQYKLISDRLDSDEIKSIQSIASRQLKDSATTQSRMRVREMQAFTDELVLLASKRAAFLRLAMESYSVSQDTLKWKIILSFVPCRKHW